jgi:hypothetical protein
MEGNTVFLARLGRNVGRPLDHARNASALAEKTHPLARVSASWALGMAQNLAQEWADAIEALENGLILVREHRGFAYWEPLLLAILAESYLGAGNTELARRGGRSGLSRLR